MKTLIVHTAGVCFVSNDGCLSLISIFALGKCNMNFDHNDFKPLILTSAK